MTAQLHRNQSPSYAYGLDIARFVCALMVSAFHLTWRNTETALYAPFGWVGVQVFFVISGAVVANSAASATPTQFIKGRFLRLYPAAWIAGVLNVVFLLAMPTEAYLAIGITAKFSFESIFQSFILFGSQFLASAYWTLPIEIAFYTLVLLCLFNGGAERFRLIARALVALSSPYLIVLALSYSGFLDLTWIDLGYGLKNTVLLRHGGFFAIGIYFWLITSSRQLECVDYFLLVLSLFTGGLEIYSRAAKVLDLYAVTKGDISIGTLGFAAFAIFVAFASFIFLSLRNADAWIPAARFKKALRTLGLITYPYYLIHELMGSFVLTQALEAGFGRLPGIFGALIAVGGVAYLIANYGEPFVRRLILSVISHATSLAEAGDKDPRKHLR